MSLKNLHTLLAVAGVMALGATAHAQSTFMESVTDPSSTVMVGGTLTFNVPQFNAALGTLTSVDLTLTPSFGDVQPWDFSTIAQTITLASVNSPSGSLVDSALGLTESWSGVQNPSGQTENVTISTPYTYGYGAPQTFSYTAPAASVTGVSPSGFIGGGTDPISFTSSGTALSGGTGTPSDTYVGWTGNIGGELDITYNYIPVPEPATISLIATGLLGALAVRRRKA